MVHLPSLMGLSYRFQKILINKTQASQEVTQRVKKQPGKKKKAFPTITISSTQRRTNTNRAKEGREKENRNTPVSVTFSDLLFL